MNRPTPETDAFAKAMYSRGVDSHHDGREALKHAKRLERERDEARTTIEDAKRALNATDYEGILLAAMRVKEERDEAMELLASEKITRNHIIKRSVEVEKERDEAREALRAFKHDKKHLCDSHRDMRGNCMVCSMEETK